MTQCACVCACVCLHAAWQVCRGFNPNYKSHSYRLTTLQQTGSSIQMRPPIPQLHCISMHPEEHCAGNAGNAGNTGKSSSGSLTPTYICELVWFYVSCPGFGICFAKMPSEVKACLGVHLPLLPSCIVRHTHTHAHARTYVCIPIDIKGNCFAHLLQAG